MSKLRTSVGIIKSLWFYLIGKKINQTNLSFGTVDWDDIKIAIKFLLRPIPKSSLQIIQTYENAFSSFNGSKFAFSFFQGRVALNACLYALDLKEGDKIVIPAYTCVGVANACWIQKLKIEFCDIELETFGLSFMDFEAILSKHPDVRAVVVQHLFGLVCRDFQQILDYCKQKGIYVIEDCAHATGTEFKGRKVGNFGEVAFFSSEQSKVFNTLTGGMAVTNNKQLASKMATFREKCKVSSKKQNQALLAHFIHGYYKNKHPYRAVLGPVIGKILRLLKKDGILKEEALCTEAPSDYYRKLPACLAAIGTNQLKKLSNYQEKRKNEWKKWEAWCVSKKIKPSLIIPSSAPVLLRYPVLVDSSFKQKKEWAASLNIVLGVWFVSYLHPIEFDIIGCPNAKRAIDSCINFPTLFF